ncbi:sensor histidine kinase [Paenibacillus sp. HJGM_3]|uniref:cache domain-containing sensor histidine kinase n=1 Tax=Paenibacillus sp. HJGM_3 TaxID=3379816 RepID=UPI00385B688B
MKRWRLPTLTLYQKLLFLLLVSVYIPVFSLGFFSNSQYGRQLEKAAEAFLSDNLQMNAQRMEEWFDDVERRSVDIYSSSALQRLLISAKNDQPQEIDFLYELGKIRYSLAGPYDLSIYPADLDKYAGYGTLIGSMPQLDTDWFGQALQSDGRGFWLSDESANASGMRQTDFYYIRLIRSLDGRFQNLGVMVIRAPSPFVQKRLVTNDRYARYQLTVIDGNGRNLLDPASRFGPSFFSRLPIPQDSGRLDRLPAISSDNTLYYADALALRYNGWRVAAMIPVSDVLGPINAIKQYTWLALAASLAVITTLLALLTRHVTVPIRTVVRYMRRVRQGALDRCDPYTQRRDEIGQLVGGYNAMIGGMLDLLETTKQAEREKRKLELQMLMHQINPHFLFNTLDAIKWKAESAQQAAIADMATALADLLRFSLNEGEELTTLERELEHMKSYVFIEQLRKGGFQVLYHVQPSLLNVPFMKLILQPIVENAVRHGMDRLPFGEGKLLISVFREERSIVCIVEDNGPGCTPEQLSALTGLLSSGNNDRPVENAAATSESAGTPGRIGLGLRNVHRRLAVSFGDEYGLTLASSPTSGLRVVIRHPMLEHTP